jgi:hypothetical protein
MGSFAKKKTSTFAKISGTTKLNPLLLRIDTLNIFYCSKRQKDKTQVKQLRQSSPITYISKYTIEHNNI